VPRKLPPGVVDFVKVRSRRRVKLYESKIAKVVESNRRVIGRLFSSGALFTRQGTRVGRDLLLAHQHLLRVVSLMHRLTGAPTPPSRRRAARPVDVFRELDELLERTSDLTHRTGDYLAKLRMD